MCDKYYLLFLIISFAIVVVLLFIYLIVGFYNYKRINEIEYYQELRKKNISLKPLPLRDFVRDGIYYFELTPDPNGWYNKEFANYYGFDSVKLK